MRVCASWLARAYPVWTRMARARAVAVLNAAMRMAWVMSLVCTSRTRSPSAQLTLSTLLQLADQRFGGVDMEGASRRIIDPVKATTLA